MLLHVPTEILNPKPAALILDCGDLIDLVAYVVDANHVAGDDARPMLTLDDAGESLSLDTVGGAS